MVANVPDYCMDEVADHTVALFLACIRKIPLLNAGVRRGAWSVDLAKPIPRLQGKRYGLFGFGNIAQRVAKRVQAFGLQVMAFDPYLPAELFAAQQITRAASLEALLGAVDFLSVHAPLTEETRGILDAARLKLLKPTAVIVNTSRGPLINEADLLAALRDGTIAGAGLDVLNDEPPTFPLALAALDKRRAHPAHRMVFRRRHARTPSEGVRRGRPRPDGGSAKVLGEPAGFFPVSSPHYPTQEDDT